MNLARELKKIALELNQAMMKVGDTFSEEGYWLYYTPTLDMIKNGASLQDLWDAEEPRIAYNMTTDQMIRLDEDDDKAYLMVDYGYDYGVFDSPRTEEMTTEAARIIEDFLAKNGWSGGPVHTGELPEDFNEV